METGTKIVSVIRIFRPVQYTDCHILNSRNQYQEHKEYLQYCADCRKSILVFEVAISCEHLGLIGTVVV
jgi:hypothetical protein